MALSCCFFIFPDCKLYVAFNFNSFLVIFSQLIESFRTADLLLSRLLVVGERKSCVRLASKSFFVKSILHKLPELKQSIRFLFCGFVVVEKRFSRVNRLVNCCKCEHRFWGVILSWLFVNGDWLLLISFLTYSKKHWVSFHAELSTYLLLLLKQGLLLSFVI